MLNNAMLEMIRLMEVIVDDYEKVKMIESVRLALEEFDTSEWERMTEDEKARFVYEILDD